jgi:UDP-N-acetylglucosamine--dolichyl-phosphate N-acetylglucosaminephosphotransferase
MQIILFVPILLGFFVCLLLLPVWIKRAKEVGLAGKDMHKKSDEKVSESGGICVVVGFIFGVLIYIAIKTYYYNLNPDDKILEIITLISSILIVSFIGFSDDILGWKKGLPKTVRILFLVFGSLPLVVISAGGLIIGGVDLNLPYSFILIPLGFVGATATFNFLAGYNGLETSQGAIILFALSLVTFFMGITWLSMIGLIMVACLTAFYIFNKHPAKVFPGDVLTYPIGALIAGMAILGSIEKIAIFFFIPYILETILKARGKLKKESFAKVSEDGSLEMPYDKIYGLEHLAIYILKKIKPSRKVYEKDVVYLINAFQILVIILGFIIFQKEIFALGIDSLKHFIA